MSGITRVSKESIFSVLNNLKAITTTSDEYADCFGFTQKEVLEDLEEFGLLEHVETVKNGMMFLFLIIQRIFIICG